MTNGSFLPPSSSIFMYGDHQLRGHKAVSCSALCLAIAMMQAILA